MTCFDVIRLIKYARPHLELLDITGRVDLLRGWVLPDLVYVILRPAGVDHHHVRTAAGHSIEPGKGL